MGHIFIQKFICDIVSKSPYASNQEVFLDLRTRCIKVVLIEI